MKFNDYISTHQIFTKKDLLSNSDSVYSANKQLNLAVKTNKVLRVCQGVYVSNFDKYHDQTVNFLQIPYVLNHKSVLCYSGATKLYGIQHNRLNYIYYYADKNIKQFTFNGLVFNCIKKDKHRFSELQSCTKRIDGVLVNVTSIEQTIVDCLDKPQYNGGFEETIRSIIEFPFINEDAIKRILNNKSTNLIAKIGWFFSLAKNRLNISDQLLSDLEILIGKGPYKFSNNSSLGWSNR